MDFALKLWCHLPVDLTGDLANAYKHAIMIFSARLELDKMAICLWIILNWFDSKVTMVIEICKDYVCAKIICSLTNPSVEITRGEMFTSSFLWFKIQWPKNCTSFKSELQFIFNNSTLIYKSQNHSFESFTSSYNKVAWLYHLLFRLLENRTVWWIFCHYELLAS